MTDAIERYWAQFRASRPGGTPRRYLEAFFFGMDPAEAAAINRLVLDGTKTATGSLLWALETDGKTPPQVGDHSIVTDGGDRPVCVIETTDVRVLPFDDVGEAYARWGGEGDRTLASWRELYWRYIVAECARIGRPPSRRAPLVMERFQVVYAAPLRGGAPESDETKPSRPAS